MGIFRRFLGRDHAALEEALQRKRAELHDLGRSQARAASLTVMGEATSLVESCAVLRKPRAPEAYVDLALGLISYPPELGFVIACQFSELEGALGYQPFGTIMTAVANIDSLYRGGYIRRSTLGAAQTTRVIADQSFRLEQAGKFMAVGLIMIAENITEAKGIYREGIYGPSIKPILDRELARHSPEFARVVCA